MQTNAVGQVVLKLKTRWPDGTTHLVMSPLECMQRLALVPRLRLHMIRFHGVLARSLTTSAKLRALVVPQEPEPAAQAAQPAQCEANCAHHRPVRLSWAKLLKRVFEIDLKHCPNCGGELQDHCCHPGATGDREDPRAPGAAGRLWTQERLRAVLRLRRGMRLQAHARPAKRGLQGRAPPRAAARSQSLQAA